MTGPPEYADQLSRIPSRLLFEKGTRRLREWLIDRGLVLSLLETPRSR